MHYHQADREEFIKYLSEKFPKCFFEDPAQRRPLKHNILVDLEKQNILNPEMLSQAVDWYPSHFAFRRSLLAGAERVDLDGNKVGTVTLQEQHEARAWITARQRESAERREIKHLEVEHQRAATAAVEKPVNGHVANGVVASPTLHPSLEQMQSALAITSNILTDKQYEQLRPVLATAALKEIITRAETLIGSLQEETTP
jgi:sRNA-binding protein